MTEPAAFAGEAGWARRHELVPLTPEVAASLLEPVSSGSGIAALEPLSGGLVNSNYRVRLADNSRELVVRIYTRDAEACRREAALYALVAGRVPVPEILHVDPSCSRYPRPYTVMTWVSGESLPQAIAAGASSAHAAGVAAGTTLVALQTLRFSRPGFFSPELEVTEELDAGAFQRHIEENLFQRGGATRLGEALAQELWAFVCANDRYFPQGDTRVVLCHGDFKAGNMLLRRRQPGWEMAALLDWEFAFAGPPLFDFAALLRHSHQQPPELEDGVVSGYTEAGGVLPHAWKRSVKLLDVANFSDFLAMPDRGGTVVDDVRRLILHTTQAWDSYPA